MGEGDFFIIIMCTLDTKIYMYVSTVVNPIKFTNYKYARHSEALPLCYSLWFYLPFLFTPPLKCWLSFMLLAQRILAIGSQWIKQTMEEGKSFLHEQTKYGHGWVPPPSHPGGIKIYWDYPNYFWALGLLDMMHLSHLFCFVVDEVVYKPMHTLANVPM